MRKLRKMDVVSVENPPMIAVVSEILPDGRVRLLAPELKCTGGPYGDDDATDFDDASGAYDGSDCPKVEYDVYDQEELKLIDTLDALADPCYNMQREDDIQTWKFLTRYEE